MQRRTTLDSLAITHGHPAATQIPALPSHSLWLTSAGAQCSHHWLSGPRWEIACVPFHVRPICLAYQVPVSMAPHHLCPDIDMARPLTTRLELSGMSLKITLQIGPQISNWGSLAEWDNHRQSLLHAS